MKDTRVVVFTENNARIVINPEKLGLYRTMANAVVDPDLSLVEKVPPHLWCLRDGVVQKLDEESILPRLQDIVDNGAVNHFQVGPKPEVVELPHVPPEPARIPPKKKLNLKIPLFVILYTTFIVFATIHILKHLG